MRLFPSISTLDTKQTVLLILAVIASITAGSIALVYDSPISPFIVGGGIASLAFVAVLFGNPTLALYTAIFVVFLPPFSNPSSASQTVDQIRSLLNRSVTLIALLSWLLDVIARRRRVTWSITALSMLGFISWGIITLAWSPDLGRGLEKIGQYTLRFILYILLITNQITNEKSLSGLMRILSINGWILLIVGIIAMISKQYSPGDRLQVLTMDQNEFGIKLLVTTTPILWRLLQTFESKQNMQRNVLNIIYVLLALVLVALSGSRGSAVAWLATLLTLSLWKPTRQYGILIIIVLVIAMIITPFIFSTLFERFTDASTLGGRLYIWKADWLIIQKYPLGGVGIGNAGSIISEYVKLITSKFKNKPEIASHNAVLQIWVETGLIGLFFYLSVLSSALWQLVRWDKRNQKTGMHSMSSYFALILSTAIGVILWWLQGGASEHDHTFFMLIAFLVIPSQLAIGTEGIVQSDHIDTTSGNL